MFGALLYLRLTSLKNLVLARVRRLRQPKYLVGAIVGAAYFYLVIFRQAGGGRPPGPGVTRLPTVLPPDLLPAVLAVAAVVLAVIVLLGWIIPDQRAGIAFSEAEIAFLFPAPVRRRTLVFYKLLNSQLNIVFTVLLLTLFTGRWRFLGGNVYIHAAGWWVILATLNLHFMAASFAMTRLMDKGITPWRRRLILLGLGVVAAVILVVWIGRDVQGPQAPDLKDARAIVTYLGTVLGTGPLPWLLWPAKVVVAPFLAQTTPDFFAALGPALALFALHYLWVMRAEVSFEDASIAKSEKRAARIAAVREGNWRAASGAMKARVAPFRLASTGRPEIAFLWKNLVSTFPLFRARIFGVAVVLIVAGCQWVARNPSYVVLAKIVPIFALISGGYTLFLGPQLARQDLRSDLNNADILKTYPLPGWQIVLGEMLTPIAILTGCLWLVLLTLGLSFHPQQVPWLSPGLRTTLVICLVPIVPVVCALQLMIPNAAAILFPAWIQTMRNRTERGIEMLGQRIIFVGGQLIVIALVLVPAVLAASVLIFVLKQFIILNAAVAIATAGILFVLVVEVIVGLWWLGQRFDRFDLSAELRS